MAIQNDDQTYKAIKYTTSINIKTYLILSPLTKGHNFNTQFTIAGLREKEKKQALMIINVWLIKSKVN